jgi:hypothetical protein
MARSNYVHSAERIEYDAGRIEITRSNYVYSAGRIEYDAGRIEIALRIYGYAVGQIELRVLLFEGSIEQQKKDHSVG